MQCSGALPMQRYRRSPRGLVSGCRAACRCLLMGRSPQRGIRSRPLRCAAMGRIIEQDPQRRERRDDAPEQVPERNRRLLAPGGRRLDRSGPGHDQRRPRVARHTGTPGRRGTGGWPSCGSKATTGLHRAQQAARHRVHDGAATCRKTSSTSWDTMPAIFPVGRLDKDSEGLILLTNDGDIVNGILRSEHGHEKEYLVTVDRPVTQAFIEGMARGVPILDTVTRPMRGRRGRQEHLPHRADAGAESADPAHVPALRLHRAASAARAHHASAARAARPG